MLTSKRISKAIYEKYGISGVMVHCSGGSCHWYSDANKDAAEVIYSGDNTIPVCRINHLTLDQWLSEFKIMWDENNACTL